jgi:hypothetical protein
MESRSDHADAKVVLGVQFLEFITNRSQLAVGGLDGDAGLEPSYQAKVVRTAYADRIAHERREAHGIEVVGVAFRHYEIGRQDADDGTVDVIQADLLADDIRDTAERRLPCLPRNDGDERGIAPGVLLAEVVAYDKADAKRREKRRLHPLRLDDLRHVARIVDRVALGQPRPE